MAKVEQFPDQSGENGITENIKDQKTREIFDTGRRQGNSQMPDDSLLMGSSTGKNPARETAGEKAQGKSQGENALTYKDQIKKHRERIRIYRIFGTVIAVIVLLLMVLFFTTRRYNRAEIVKVRDFPAEEGAVCVNFDGHVLQYGPNGATCSDTNGRVKWSITYEMDQPIVSMSGDMAAIADYGGTSIYVMSVKKQLYTVNTSIPVHKVSVSECGEVAAILNDSTKSWIRLYSREGKEIAYFIRSMEENGFPMEVAVSPDGEKVCVSSLLMKDDSVVSNLSFYNFGKAGKKYDQHLVGYFEYTNEVFPYVRFMGNKACAAASDSRLVVFDTSGTEPQNSFNNMLTENLQGIFASEGRIGLLFTDLTRENLYHLDLFGRDGKKEGSVGFTMVFDNIQIKGSKVYINNERSMQIYTVNGREVFNGGFDRAVKTLIPSSRLSGLAAVSENEIDKIKLR